MLLPLHAAAIAYAETVGVMHVIPCLHALVLGHVAPPERFSYLVFARAFNRWIVVPSSRTIWS